MTNEKLSSSPSNKVNELYEKYKSKFPNSFLHNMLWKLLVDKTRKLNDAAFTPVIKNGYTELGIADKGELGYQSTGIIFETHNYDIASDICDELNKDVFGIDIIESQSIVYSSI